MKRSIIVGFIISAVFIYLTVRGIEFSAVIQSFRSANYLYVIPIVLIIILVLFFRSYRWGIILEPCIKYHQWPLFVITSIGFMTISILPARLGEFTRPLLVKQKSGIRISSTMATIVVERVFDLLTLMFFLCVVLIRISLPPEIAQYKKGLIISGMLLVIVFVLLLLVVLKKELSIRVINFFLSKFPKRIETVLEPQFHAFIEGLEILPDVKKTLYVALLSVIIWVLLGLSCYILFFSFVFKLSLMNAFALTIIIAIGVMLPAAPGFVGNFDYACKLGLKFFGVGEAEATSYAFALHFLQLIPVIAIGLGLFPSQKISLRGFFKKEAAEKSKEGFKS